MYEAGPRLSPRPPRRNTMGAPDTEEALPEPVDLDVDIQRRTPSGWPSQSVPPPLAVTLNGRQYTCVPSLLLPNTFSTLNLTSIHAGCARARRTRACTRCCGQFPGCLCAMWRLACTSSAALASLSWALGWASPASAPQRMAPTRFSQTRCGGLLCHIRDLFPCADGAPAAQDTRLTALNVEAAQAVGVSGSVVAAPCDWESPQAFLESAACDNALGWDWILGSDIVYHQQFDYTHIQALAKLLATLLGAAKQQGKKPPTILFGYQERDSAARLAFWEALASHGLGVTLHTLVRGNARCAGWRLLPDPPIATHRMTWRRRARWTCPACLGPWRCGSSRRWSSRRTGCAWHQRRHQLRRRDCSCHSRQPLPAHVQLCLQVCSASGAPGS